MNNRGRFQAQGKKLEESESWAQEKGIELDESLKLIEKLKTKIPRRELNIRKKVFEKTKKMITVANSNGGIKVDGDKIFSKSYIVFGKERVDTEVFKGEAFI
ncbi:hypothetical protein C1631_014775 [Chryseobacterium phosphatilyticum]|uniref:Uncharacterized protein n=1 Tax=Chryseobacterium phosphatilyticum TaxID=475075 RepID=A0A316X971_9FLAO|nr:hypothetical protein [Chryseobacterium phosphatilyticum]PWN69316.1 hypothetical protein C1631_014775 [Chryseobacterium phosphatilyticum]